MSDRLNGWDVAAMTEAIQGVEREPGTGLLTWRSRARWDGGFGLDVRAREIEQSGKVMARHFTLRSDHPPELLGENTGKTAIEIFLAALAACMTGSFAAQATARGVAIETLEADLEGQIDLNGFFGLKPIRPGLFNVKLAFRVKSDAEADVLQEILEAARSLSPIFDSVTRPVGVETSLEKM